jgi:hypothetical protein
VDHALAREIARRIASANDGQGTSSRS